MSEERTMKRPAPITFDVVVMSLIDTIVLDDDADRDAVTTAFETIARHELHSVRFDDPTERWYEFTIPAGVGIEAIKTVVKVKNEPVS